jgi:DDE superfamily endonuclease
MAARLDLYEAPADPTRPRVCVDERPCQVLGDGREPRPMVPEHPARVNDEDSRHGTCHLLMMVEPCQGWRQVTVTPRRTKREFAHGMRELVEVHCPEAEKIRVVLDHLSPHTPEALDEVLAPAEARRILRKLAFHLTPVHGSWLTMAAIELAVLARQCLNRRIPTTARMIRETSAWQARRHRCQAVIDWRFTTADARIKLKSLYPKESE